MKIGLIDVDNNARRKVKHRGHLFPNLALMKIARYHKKLGDDVEWAIPFFRYDKIYMSRVFTIYPDDKTAYNCDNIVRGGTGYDIHDNMPQEIDRLQPDYSIYPFVDKKTSYGFLTRGCIRKCKWCVVPIKEGAIRPYMDIDDIVIENRTNVVLMDNNFLACGDYAMEQLDKIIQKGYRIDLNQANDARIITDDIAKKMAKVKWIGNMIRFGCDTKAQIEPCVEAIDKLRSHGYNGNVMLYTMLHGTLEECYERLTFWRNNYDSKISCQAQPMLDFTKEKQNIPQWQKDMARWCNQHTAFRICDFKDFRVRNGFYCREHFK